VHLARSITRVIEGHVLMSNLYANDEKVIIQEPEICLEIEQADTGSLSKPSVLTGKDRDKQILEKLRLEHLNEEERQRIERTCFD
jgi:hypothetical protein